MPKAILFDLYETLVTESATEPPGVASLASQLGCEREGFRHRWKALRPAVIRGELSFSDALRRLAADLGGRVDDAKIKSLSDARRGMRALAFASIDQDVEAMVSALRNQGVRLGVVSNCCAEDVAAWPDSPLAPLFDAHVFSCDVRVAKPDAEIYRHGLRRLRMDADDTWYIGDGGDDELEGAQRAGLRAFRALWFLKRWPHHRATVDGLLTPADVLALLRTA